MLIGAFMPIVEFFIVWGMKFAFRFLDKKFSKDEYYTQKKSIQLYIDTYSGPDYMIHFKYSTIMNVVFVTLMFGTALPILYPICFFGLIILFIAERL
jgi:hypothetical protein